MNKISKAGFTALHLAAGNNHKDIVELLLRYGASKSIRDNLGKIPGDLARDKNHFELDNLLYFPNFQATSSYYTPSLFSHAPKQSIAVYPESHPCTISPSMD